MLLSDEEGKDVKVGTPFVDGSKVELKVLEQFKGEKVRVFKMKAKKRYARNL
jgi:large subunit ribosomal protein L21